MRKAIWLFLIFGMFVWRVPLIAEAAQMRAGLAKVEITPPAKGTPLSGYAARTSGSIGVLDPLYAKALVLECGDKKLAIVTLDIIEFPSERVPREAKERFGVGLVLLASSHTHFGPNFQSRRWPEPGGGKKQYQWTEDRIIEAIGKAAEKMFPARLSLAKGEIQLGYNRLVLQPDGRRKPLFRNPERIPYGPVDPTVSIIRVEDTDAGTTRALVVGYACHPVNLAQRCLLISADYPGAMMAKVEDTLSGRLPASSSARRKAVPQPPQPTGDVMCLFVQGGGGSVNPFFIEERTGEPDAITGHKKMGELLADEVLKTARTAQPLRAKGPDEMQWRTETLSFKHRWSTTATVPVEMATVLINRTIGIAAVPGESFCSLQTMYKRDAPVKFPLYAGYTTCGGAEWPDYIPDIRAAAEGGYGADYATHIQPGAAERIVNQALIDLWWMKGFFSDKPGR
jgi:hypothetical protein